MTYLRARIANGEPKCFPPKKKFAPATYPKFYRTSSFFSTALIREERCAQNMHNHFVDIYIRHNNHSDYYSQI